MVAAKKQCSPDLTFINIQSAHNLMASALGVWPDAGATRSDYWPRLRIDLLRRLRLADFTALEIESEGVLAYLHVGYGPSFHVVEEEKFPKYLKYYSKESIT
jgi:hypothetical protein